MSAPVGFGRSGQEGKQGKAVRGASASTQQRRVIPLDAQLQEVEEVKLRLKRDVEAQYEAAVSREEARIREDKRRELYDKIRRHGYLLVTWGRIKGDDYSSLRGLVEEQIKNLEEDEKVVGITDDITVLTNYSRGDEPKNLEANRSIEDLVKIANLLEKCVADVREESYEEVAAAISRDNDYASVSDTKRRSARKWSGEIATLKIQLAATKRGKNKTATDTIAEILNNLSEYTKLFDDVDKVYELEGQIRKWDEVSRYIEEGGGGDIIQRLVDRGYEAGYDYSDFNRLTDNLFIDEGERQLAGAEMRGRYEEAVEFLEEILPRLEAQRSAKLFEVQGTRGGKELSVEAIEGEITQMAESNAQQQEEASSIKNKDPAAISAKLIKERQGRAQEVVASMKQLWRDDIGVGGVTANPLKSLAGATLAENPTGVFSIKIPMLESGSASAERLKILLSEYFRTDVIISSEPNSRTLPGSKNAYELTIPIDHVLKSEREKSDFFNHAKHQRSKVIDATKNPKDFIGRSTAGIFSLAVPVIMPLAALSWAAGAACRIPVLSLVTSPVASIFNAFAQTLLESSSTIFKAIGLEEGSKWASDQAKSILNSEKGRLRKSSGYSRTFPRFLQEITSGVGSVASVIMNGFGAPIHMAADKLINLARSSNPVAGFVPGLIGSALKIVAATVTTAGKFFSNIAENYQRSDKPTDTWQYRWSKAGRNLVEKGQVYVSETNNVKLNFADQAEIGKKFDLSKEGSVSAAEWKQKIGRTKQDILNDKKFLEEAIQIAAKLIPIAAEDVGVMLTLSGDQKMKGNRPYIKLAQFEIGAGEDAKEIIVLLGQDGKPVIASAKAIDGKHEIINVDNDFDYTGFYKKFGQVVNPKTPPDVVVGSTLQEFSKVGEERLFWQLKELSKTADTIVSNEITEDAGQKVAVYKVKISEKNIIEVHIPVTQTGTEPNIKTTFTVSRDGYNQIKIGHDDSDLRDFTTLSSSSNSDAIKLVSTLAKALSLEKAKAPAEVARATSQRQQPSGGPRGPSATRVRSDQSQQGAYYAW